MNKKRILIKLLIVLIIVLNINICVYGSENSYNANRTVNSLATPESDILQTGKDWIEKGKSSDSLPKRADWLSMNSLVNMLWGAGVIVAIAGGMILGIKYMLASADEKANIKESMKPYLIGTILILGALSIWKVSITFLDTL